MCRRMKGPYAFSCIKKQAEPEGEGVRITKRTAEILKRMDEKYGTELFTYLEHHTPEQLLVALMKKLWGRLP